MTATDHAQLVALEVRARLTRGDDVRLAWGFLAALLGGLEWDDFNGRVGHFAEMVRSPTPQHSPLPRVEWRCEGAGREVWFTLG